MQAHSQRRIEDYSNSFSDDIANVRKALDTFHYCKGDHISFNIESGSLSIKVIREDLKGDGYLIGSNGELTIFLASRFNAQEEKVVMAHELAHLLRRDYKPQSINRTLLHYLLPRLDSKPKLIHDYKIEIEAERLCREILMPNESLGAYTDMQHSLYSARKIAKNTGITVGSVLARLTYDTGLWDDVSFGLYTTYCFQNSCKSLITVPYSVNSLYYANEPVEAYAGTAIDAEKSKKIKLPEVIQNSAGVHTRYRKPDGKEVELEEPTGSLIRRCTADFINVMAGVDRSFSSNGITVEVGFEHSKILTRLECKIPEENITGNLFVLVS